MFTLAKVTKLLWPGDNTNYFSRTLTKYNYYVKNLYGSAFMILIAVTYHQNNSELNNTHTLLSYFDTLVYEDKNTQNRHSSI